MNKQNRLTMADKIIKGCIENEFLNFLTKLDGRFNKEDNPGNINYFYLGYIDDLIKKMRLGTHEICSKG